MPPITLLPLLGLLFPALATLLCSALGRPWPRRPGIWARWVLRLGLLLTLADVLTLLDQLPPGGTLTDTLWQAGPRLPITLAVDASGTLLAAVIVVAALVVSFAARDRRPLASAALGLAVVGAVVATFAGDLLSLYIGLQLSSLGGIGLSYARQPRSASSRMLWAAVVDQAIGLAWLGAIVGLLHRTATLQLTAIPIGSVSPALAGLLIVPAVARLVGCGLVAGSVKRGRARGIARSLDVADWLAVVAVPTAGLLLIRVQALSGGSWPAQWFGTSLDLFALLMALTAVVGVLFSNHPQSGLRSLLLLLGALVIVGFGQNSSDGTLLGLGAALYLETCVLCLPRALMGRTGAGSPSGAPRRGGVGGLPAGRDALALLPFLLGLGVALLGMDLALRAGLADGVSPALAYLVALIGLALTVPRLRQAATLPISWSWPLWLPAACLVATALAPGWTLTVAAAALAPAGTSSASLLSAPDPLAVLAPGLIWPGGYLAILLALVGGGAGALQVATGARSRPTGAGLDLAVSPVIPLPPQLARWLAREGQPRSGPGEIRGWAATLVGLADRELAERPVWLWVATASAVAWLLAEVVRP